MAIVNTTNPIHLDPDLGKLIRDAAESGRSLTVTVDDRRYDIAVTPAGSDQNTDMWQDYDAEQVRAAVRRSRAKGSSMEEEELDPLIAEIRAQRDQTPRHSGA